MIRSAGQDQPPGVHERVQRIAQRSTADQHWSSQASRHRPSALLPPTPGLIMQARSINPINHRLQSPIKHRSINRINQPDQSPINQPDQSVHRPDQSRHLERRHERASSASLARTAPAALAACSECCHVAWYVVVTWHGIGIRSAEGMRGCGCGVE